jgi:hypothetical protein
MATNMTPHTKVLASGRIAWIDAHGIATLATCGWMVEVPSGHPEPDSPADLYRTVTCDAPEYAVDPTDADAGWFCTNGHRHLTYGSPAQVAQERLESFMEFAAATHPALADALDRGESFREIADRTEPWWVTDPTAGTYTSI